MSSIISPLSITLTNGTTADATQVMADLNQIVSNVNANALNKDGTTALTGDFDSGGHKIKNLADGVSSADAVTIGQLSATSGASLSGWKQAGAGAVSRTVNDKLLENAISSADYGVPGDLTDDGNNHLRLHAAAVAAIQASRPLLIVGKILVSNTVDWDTRGSGFNGLDPYIPNGSPKNLDVFGEPGSGIYGKASAFTGLTKSIVSLSTQNTRKFFGVDVKIYDSSAIANYTTFTNITGLLVLSSDRNIIIGCSVGGMLYPNGAINPGAGYGVVYDDCIGNILLYNDVHYQTIRGVIYTATQGAMRANTSGRIEGNHISVGNPSASSRNDCQGIIPGSHNMLCNNIFENYDKGRALNLTTDFNFVTGNWFEGTYDTVLLSGGVCHTFFGNIGIGSNLNLALIEATGGSIPGGALALAASNTTALQTSFINHTTNNGGSNWQNSPNMMQRRNAAYPVASGAYWNAPNAVRFADGDATSAQSKTNPPLQIENNGGLFGFIASRAGSLGGEGGIVVKAPSGANQAIFRFAAGGVNGDVAQIGFGDWNSPGNTKTGTITIEPGSVSGYAVVSYGNAGTRTVLHDNITP